MILDPPLKRWRCPSCGVEAQTRETRPHSQMHSCPAMGGLTAPLVEFEADATHELVVREDYVGLEHGLVWVDGRPITSIVTRHADGHTDCAVYAPLAVSGATN